MRTGSKTGKIGGTTVIRISAAASKLISGAILLAITSPAIPQERVARLQALAWAQDNRAAIFDTLMPAVATDDASAPHKRAFSLRSLGGADKFEFAVTVVQDYDGTAQGTLVVTDGQPLVIQLAALRATHPEIDLIGATHQLKLRRIALSAASAKQIISLLTAVSVPLTPSSLIGFDATGYEVTTVAFSRLQVNVIPTDERAWRSLNRAIARIVELVGMQDSRRRFDPTSFEQ